MLEVVNELFNNYDNWAAYVDLKNKEKEIIQLWQLEFQKKLNNVFSHSYADWKIEYAKTKDIYISPAHRKSRKSVEFWLEHEKNTFVFSLWANGAYLDVPQVYKVFNEKLYQFENSISERIALSLNESDQYIFRLDLKYNLSKQIGYNSELLNYFIKDELPDRILEFLDPLLTNKEIYKLIEEINDNCLL